MEEMKRKSIRLPRFTIGEDCFMEFEDEMKGFGKKAAVIYGEKAWSASEAYVVPALLKAGVDVVCRRCYGREATFGNVESIVSDKLAAGADMLIAVGGGKCIDTVKLAADRMGKPVFTVPSIASNCAPVTQISILYNENGSFCEIVKLKAVPVHCFIHPGIILAAPTKYLWAGIGDAMAKHVESEWSAKAGEALNFGSELGIAAGRLCFFPMLHYAPKALRDAGEGRITEELKYVLLDVVIAPGITSVSVDPEYNGAVAHALFYGLSSRETIEKEHLHGEVVSYGTLVNLMLDFNETKLDGAKLAETWSDEKNSAWERLRRVYELNRAIGLPSCLADLGLTASDPLEDVLAVAMANQELMHTPYPVSRESIHKAILDLESFTHNRG